MDPAFRHLALCDNAILPGGRTPLHVAGQPVGYVDPSLIPTLQDHGATIRSETLHIDGDTLQPLAQALAAEGLFTWRDEPFDVRPTPDSPPVAQLDRGALPLLGIAATGVHLDAIVLQDGTPHLWVATRSRTKLLDPGKLDHLVAGGIPAGLTPIEALHKEAEEEAGLPAHLLEAAIPHGIVEYAMARDEGLRRDRLYCYELVLPHTFVPEPRDGEVESFALWPLPQVLDRLRHTDDFKFNVPLVLIRLLQRHGLLLTRSA